MQSSLLSLSGSAELGAIQALRLAFPTLPDEYFSYLSLHNGGEGPLGVEPGWFILWPAEEALVATAEYQMSKYLPGYMAFGGNGGGELFVFPIQPATGAMPVYMVPAIGMEPAVLIEVASTFGEFVSAFREHLAPHA